MGFELTLDAQVLVFTFSLFHSSTPRWSVLFSLFRVFGLGIVSDPRLHKGSSGLKETEELFRLSFSSLSICFFVFLMAFIFIVLVHCLARIWSCKKV